MALNKMVLFGLCLSLFVLVLPSHGKQKSQTISMKRVPVRISEKESHKLSLKMVSFLEIVGILAEAIYKKDYHLMKKNSLRLVELTKHNSELKSKAENLSFKSMKSVLSKSAIDLYDSASKEDIDSFQRNYGIMLRSCFACHSSYQKEVINLPKSNF